MVPSSGMGSSGGPALLAAVAATAMGRHDGRVPRPRSSARGRRSFSGPRSGSASRQNSRCATAGSLGCILPGQVLSPSPPRSKRSSSRVLCCAGADKGDCYGSRLSLRRGSDTEIDPGDIKAIHILQRPGAGSKEGLAGSSWRLPERFPGGIRLSAPVQPVAGTERALDTCSFGAFAGGTANSCSDSVSADLWAVTPSAGSTAPPSVSARPSGLPAEKSTSSGCVFAATAAPAPAGFALASAQALRGSSPGDKERGRRSGRFQRCSSGNPELAVPYGISLAAAATMDGEVKPALAATTTGGAGAHVPASDVDRLIARCMTHERPAALVQATAVLLDASALKLGEEAQEGEKRSDKIRRMLRLTDELRRYNAGLTEPP